jgi:ABC-type phosphate transport system auxiliary subunit
MAMQLSSPSVTTTASGSATGGGTNPSFEIDRLQQQIKTLQKSLSNLPNLKLAPNAAKTQTTLLNQQIEIVRTQITRLQANQNLDQAAIKLVAQSATAKTTATAAAKSHAACMVAAPSTLAELRHQQTQQAKHQASAAAIEPAQAPTVSVKA